MEEPPESPEAGPPSPDLPAPNPDANLAPVWELPDDGTNFLNYYNSKDVLELKNWATETRARMSEEGYVVEAPLVSEFLGVLAVFSRAAMGNEIFETGSRASIWSFATVHSWVCPIDEYEQKFVEALFWEVVGLWIGKSADVGGVGRLPLNRVSRSALSVVGGLLALGGLLYVSSFSLLCGVLLWICTTNKNIFGVLDCFCKCRKYEENELMSKTSRRLNVESFDAEGS